MVFSEGEISGKILFEGNEISISENSKVIQKKNKTLIFDKQNDLKVTKVGKKVHKLLLLGPGAGAPVES